MTEQEWLASADPVAMLNVCRLGNLEAVDKFFSYEISDRKLRLWACACARQAWDRLTDPRSRRAVQVAERYADGLATMEEMRQSFEKWEKRRHGYYSTTDVLVSLCSYRTYEIANPYPARDREVPPDTQADLLRCIFGNPFRPVGELILPYRGDPFALIDIRGLARSIYDARDWAALPVLADALEEAGCVGIPEAEVWEETFQKGNAHALMDRWGAASLEEAVRKEANSRSHPLLAHLRSPGPHARGCWSLDCILGR